MITDRSGTITRSASLPWEPIKMIGVFFVSPVTKLVLIEGAITYQVIDREGTYKTSSYNKTKHISKNEN